MHTSTTLFVLTIVLNFKIMLFYKVFLNETAVIWYIHSISFTVKTLKITELFSMRYFADSPKIANLAATIIY